MLALHPCTLDALSAQILDCDSLDFIISTIVRSKALRTVVIDAQLLIVDVGARICIWVWLVVVLFVRHARLNGHQVLWAKPSVPLIDQLLFILVVIIHAIVRLHV